MLTQRGEKSSKENLFSFPPSKLGEGKNEHELTREEEVGCVDIQTEKKSLHPLPFLHVDMIHETGGNALGFP